jgi:hypothetical protein
MPETPWTSLHPDAPELPTARLTLHHAVQPVAAVGQSLLPSSPDDAQQALVLGPGGLWLGAPVAGGALRAALDPVALELLLCDGGGVGLASLPLAGRTVGEGLAFLAGELGRRGQPGRLALPQHPDDFPRHALGEDAPFEAGGERARATLADLFAATAALLARAAGPGAAVRLWPHHLDLAASLARGGVTFGLGVSPGDGPAGRPYWYVTASPAPPREARPKLEGGGRWREAGWPGAELPLEALSPVGSARRSQVAAFLDSALAG